VGRLHRWRERRRQERLPWAELADLLALSPYQFEEAVAAILRELGFRHVRRTGRSGDLSVDITFRDKDNKLVAVQCKRYRLPHKVGSVDLQQFIGMAKLHHNADLGMYVTTSDYTRSAYALAAQHPDIQLVNGLLLAEMLANVLGAPGKEVLDPRGALKEAGLTPESLAGKTRERLAARGELKELSGKECQCQTNDITWAGHREPGGRLVVVCPYCARIASPEETHEAMIYGAVAFSDQVPGLEPLRATARRRAERSVIAEEDVRFGLLLARDSVIQRKREQAARIALKQILGRKPTDKEVVALASAAPPVPEPGHRCSACGGEMPWSRRLGAYWCQTCAHAEYPMADRLIRLMVPTA